MSALSLFTRKGDSWLLKVPVCQKLLLTFQFGLDFSDRPPQPPTLLHTPRERKEIYIWIGQTKRRETFSCAALWAVHSSTAISDSVKEYRCLNITMLCVLCYCFCFSTKFSTFVWISGLRFIVKAVEPHFWSSPKSLLKGSDWS